MHATGLHPAKEASCDLPVLNQTKAEYAKLQSVFQEISGGSELLNTDPRPDDEGVTPNILGLRTPLVGEEEDHAL